MNIFKRFFNKNPVQTRIEMITDNGNGYYTWNGKLYQSDIIRACIRPKALAIGKLTPQHIRNNKQEGFKINPEVYIRFLLEDPNPLMSGQMLLEKTITQLDLNGNAFIYINRDELGYPNELYHIPAVAVQAEYTKDMMLLLKFTMRNGKVFTYPYSDIIHIRKDFNSNDIFGESPYKVLKPLMEVVNTTDQGIVNAIKNSSVIRWLLKFTSNMRPEDIKKQTEDFANNFLSTENNGTGVAGVDSKATAQQIDNKDYVPNAAQMDRSVQRLYSFYNTNDKIVQSKYDENEWQAYYENVLEPLAIQLSNEFTRKIFTRRERGFGNKIVFEASNLQYAAMSTKMQLVQMVDRGALTPNEWRKVMGLGPIKGGDEPVRRLDTAVVNTKGGE